MIDGTWMPHPHGNRALAHSTGAPADPLRSSISCCSLPTSSACRSQTWSGRSPARHPAAAAVGWRAGVQRGGYDGGCVGERRHGDLHKMAMRPVPLPPSIGYRAAVSAVRGRPRFAHLIRVPSARPDRDVWPSRREHRRGRSRRPRCARSTRGTPRLRPSLWVSSVPSCPFPSAGGAAAGVPADRGAKLGERSRAKVMGFGVGQRSCAPDAVRSALLRVRQRGGVR